jgi:hypothetical protein
MASLALRAVQPSEYDLQRGMQRQILALLRRARNPRALAAMPVMNALCVEMGTANPVAALERVVLAVFDGDDPATATLRDAILMADFSTRTNNSDLARRSGVSRRHFQRRRAEAVAAIAQYTRAVVERGRRANGDLATAVAPGRRVSASAFEGERRACLEARDRDAVLEMRSIAGNLLRLAQSCEQRSTAFDLRADANARLGRREEAAENAASLSRGARRLLTARFALLDGDCGAALQHARAALPFFDERGGERQRCFTLISQAGLGLSDRWRPLAEEPGFSCDLWARLAVDVERARHLARDGSWREAERIAGASHRCAQSRSFAELEARSAAVMHGAALERCDFEAARRWRARAVARLLTTQDRLLATGLFAGVQARGELGLDPLLTGVLYERLTLVVPQMRGESHAQAALVSELLARLAAAVLPHCDRAMGLGAAAAAVRQSDSAFAHYAAPLAGAIHETLALALTALSGKTWSETFDTLGDPLGEAVTRLRPAARRTVAVTAVPSQSAPLVHFKLNDERSSARGDSGEALADLRFRLVSV